MYIPRFFSRHLIQISVAIPIYSSLLYENNTESIRYAPLINQYAFCCKTHAQNDDTLTQRNARAK